MKKLWSPWRSNYIESFKNAKKDSSCIFCDTVDAEITDDATLVIHKGKYCYVMLNLYPYNSGHLMVIPNKHVDNLTVLGSEELDEMMKLVQMSLKALTITMKPQGFNFGANLGKAAGAGIDEHIHFHIVPRWIGDTNFMPMLGEVKVISQDLLITKKNLIQAFAEVLK